ncbi:MAG: ATP-binding cassette domain-containing protein [Erysipelotrichaceae bacterium]|nr:ATP-binding cassette domain-containing protein [Erysipelotrichaceae bacterium]
MNLKLDIPLKIQEKYHFVTYTYAISFDLHDNHYVDGFLVVANDIIYVFIDNVLTKQYRINEYESIKVQATYSGGYLYALKDKKEHIIIEFSKHYYDKIASLALGIDLYLQDGFYGESDMMEKHCSICQTPFIEGSTYCAYCNKKKNIIKNFLPFLLKYKWWIILQLFITLLVVLLSTIRPSLYQKIVDDFIDAKVFNSSFVLFVFFLLLIFFLNSVLGFFKGIVSFNVTYGFIHDLRVKVYDKVQHMSLQSANKRTTGGLISRISNDVTTISNVMTSSFTYIIFAMIQFIIIAVLMIYQNVLLTLIVILPAPIVVIICNRLWQVIGIKYQKNWKYVSSSNNTLHDILSGIKVVKTYGTENKEVERFNKASKDVKDINTYTEKFWSTYTPIINFIFGFSQVIIYYFISKSIVDGSTVFTIGDLIKWTSYASMIYTSVNMLASLPRRLNELAISADKINDILNEKDEFDSSFKENIETKGEVVFDKVRFGYISFAPVLKEISFKINPKETIGIVGYSGSGKTTLVNLIMKLYSPNHGKIYLDGQDISKIDSYAYRKQIGAVLQETLLFSGTILENIKYGNENASLNDVIRVAKMAKAHDFIMKKEFGYDSKLGKQGEGLSGGEKQRIAIARALLANPSIFIFDEATSSLDTITEKEIQDAIANISKTKTTFIIAHRLSTLQNANRLIVLNRGKMVEFGSHEQLLAKKGYYYSLVKAQYMNYEK